MKDIIRHVEGVLSTSVAHVGSRMLKDEELRAALVAERLRSERSGQPFAFAVIDVESENDGSLKREGVMKLLAEAIRQRTRSTDTKGWYAKRLALILPYTRRGNVNHVLGAIERTYIKLAQAESHSAAPVPEIRFSVYFHPPRFQESEQVERRENLQAMKNVKKG